jgi:hypothetical protein
MTVKYFSARNRRTRYVAQQPSRLQPLATLPGQPSSAAEKAIEWLSVVDEFQVRKHRNVFPRWSLVMLVLAIMAI